MSLIFHLFYRIIVLDITFMKNLSPYFIRLRIVSSWDHHGAEEDPGGASSKKRIIMGLRYKKRIVAEEDHRGTSLKKRIAAEEDYRGTSLKKRIILRLRRRGF